MAGEEGASRAGDRKRGHSSLGPARFSPASRLAQQADCIIPPAAPSSLGRRTRRPAPQMQMGTLRETPQPEPEQGGLRVEAARRGQPPLSYLAAARRRGKTTRRKQPLRPRCCSCAPRRPSAQKWTSLPVPAPLPSQNSVLYPPGGTGPEATRCMLFAGPAAPTRQKGPAACRLRTEGPAGEPAPSPGCWPRSRAKNAPRSRTEAEKRP